MFKIGFAICVFMIILMLIITEKINRTVAAITGAILMVLFKIITPHEAIGAIDFNTIGVLIGMMIIVAIIKDTGVFEYLAIYSAKKVKGDPWKIIIVFSTITAITSALLDNVTTVLLIVPMTLIITDTLKLDPIPFLIPEIIASNIGGTSTLIGDPPNIMIGSAANLGFLDFVVHLLPVIIIIYFITFSVFKILYKNKLVVDASLMKRISEFDEKKSITDYPLLRKCYWVMAFILVGFFFHEELGYASSVVALTGATILLLLSKTNVEEVFKSVEWPTIFFFSGLFVMVGSLEKVGVIHFVANSILDFTEGHIIVTGVAILWGSAIISSFLDNIPFVATLIPLISAIGASGHTDITPLWWAISLGACLGGNGTLLGASANVVVAGIAERHGQPISFMRYMKIGFPMMIISIVVSTIYLIVFYLM
ncbi:MAG: SLC13 family permease [Eubacteriales bacterium]